MAKTKAADPTVTPPETTEQKPVRSPEELRRSLEECTKRLREVKGMKKSMAKDYNDQIKGIEEEISDILSQLEG